MGPYFHIRDAGTAPAVYTGDVTKGIIIWGAQLEQRSAVTAYTPTTTAPITNYVPVLLSAANNVARFDHNPVTGESLGLLIEEQRTNLFQRSEEFNTLWAATRSSVTANTIVAPDGTLTGDKLIEDSTASNTHTVDQFLTVVTNTEYAFSCYVKAAERSHISLFAFHAASGTNNTENVVFNLSTLAVVSQTTAANRNTITAVGNGWYRVSAVVKNQIDTGTNFSIRLADNTGATSYTGDGTSGLYIWGAQLEAGAFPTSYIPTVASQVTRSADAAIMTGANFSSWYAGGAGTLFVDTLFPPIVDNVTRFTSEISVGTTSEVFATATFSASTRFRAGAVSSGGIGTLTANQPYKFAYSFENGGQSASLNGASVVTGVLTSTAQPDRLTIGATRNNSSHINTTIKKLAFYPKRLANDQLQGITTV